MRGYQNVQLQRIKILHTIAWALLVACILGIPIASWLGKDSLAAVLAMVVLGEVLLLLVNGWRCPLTRIAERYTNDRGDNFDIYLPNWLARHNKTIFGVLYVLGVIYAAAHFYTPVNG